jgi:hypothetical protein
LPDSLAGQAGGRCSAAGGAAASAAGCWLADRAAKGPLGRAGQLEAACETHLLLAALLAARCWQQAPGQGALQQRRPPPPPPTADCRPCRRLQHGLRARPGGAGQAHGPDRRRDGDGVGVWWFAEGGRTADQLLAMRWKAKPPEALEVVQGAVEGRSTRCPPPPPACTTSTTVSSVLSSSKLALYYYRPNLLTEDQKPLLCRSRCSCRIALMTVKTT